MRTGRDRRTKKRIALERIDTLFTLAERVFPYSQKLAKRYVEIALDVQKKAKVRMPRKWKRRYCKKCHTLWVPGITCTVRLRQDKMPHVVCRCLNCGHIERYPYLREKKKKRSSGSDGGRYTSHDEGAIALPQ